jgi:Fic family protein
LGGWGSFDDDDPAPDSKRAIAATNVLQLFDYAQSIVDAELSAKGSAPITPEVVRTMHAHAMRGLDASAGAYRGEGAISIDGSKHVPPPHTKCPALVEEMCSLLGRETERDPLGVATYALWRLNWIHPFEDGNGRTARMLCHVVLLVGMKLRRFPGRRSLSDRILDEKIKYWRCLGEADRAAKTRKGPNVSQLQGFLERLLKEMLREGTET